MAKVIQLPVSRKRQIDPRDEKLMSMQAYIGMRLFEMTQVRRDLVAMQKRLRLIEGKTRLRLMQDACSGDSKKAQ